LEIIKNLYKSESQGILFFNLGIFLLPSAFPLGAFSVIVALVISIVNNRKTFLKDKFNYPLLICTGIFLTSSLNNTLTFYKEINNQSSDSLFISKEYISNIWIDLFNWLPFLLIFWSLQFYINTNEKRCLFARSLIAGTVPVLISCIGQYWFEWTDKLSTLNGLIVWYQKDIEMISGLFSNPNYAGCWLAMSWPFSYFLIFETDKFPIKKFITILISLLILYFTIMTSSRNALIGIIFSSILLIKVKFILLALSLILLLILISIYSNLIIPTEIIENFREYLPKSLIYKFSKFDFMNFLNFPRIDIWKTSIKVIIKSPIFGWGAGTFSILYLFYGGMYKSIGVTHTHNFFLEIANNYGLPLAIIITLFIGNLFIRLFQAKNQIFKTNNIDRAWLASSGVAIIFFSTDMPYYDGKISLIFWILLSGIKCIGDNKTSSLN